MHHAVKSFNCDACNECTDDAADYETYFSETWCMQDPASAVACFDISGVTPVPQVSVSNIEINTSCCGSTPVAVLGVQHALAKSYISFYGIYESSTEAPPTCPSDASAAYVGFHAVYQIDTHTVAGSVATLTVTHYGGTGNFERSASPPYEWYRVTCTNFPPSTAVGPAEHLGTPGAQISQAAAGAPLSLVHNALPRAGTAYDMANNVFLPGGDGRANSLPLECTSFVFMTVTADMTAITGNPAQKVYVPCYFNLE